jgi:hypothetical protein
VQKPVPHHINHHCYSHGGMRLCLNGIEVAKWPTARPLRHEWIWRSNGIMLTGVTDGLKRKNSPSASLSTTNPSGLSCTQTQATTVKKLMTRHRNFYDKLSFLWYVTNNVCIIIITENT